MNLSRRSFLSLLGITPVALSIPTQLDFGQIVYKVVDNDQSFLVGTLHPDFVLDYSLNKFTYSKIGPIFAFSNLEAAYILVGDSLFFKIYKCKAYGVKKGKTFFSDYVFSPQEIKNLWAGKPSSICESDCDYSLDTLYCNYLKPIEEI